MSEYIKREEVLSCIARDLGNEDYRGSYQEFMTEVSLRIISLPAADVVEPPRWIPVSARLPKNNCKCLCVFTNGDVGEAHFISGLFYDPVEEYDQYFVTHWMPLPEPPEEDEDELREYIRQKMSYLVRDCRTCGCFDPTAAYCGKYQCGAETACKLCLFAKPYKTGGMSNVYRDCDNG